MQELPVVIVGGGAIGSAIAYFLTLQQPGLPVVVVERDPAYTQASSALSASSIRQQFSTGINIALSQFGIDFLRNLKTELAVGNDRPDIGLVEDGYLYLATSAGEGVLRARLTEKLRQLDPALSLHDLRIVPGRTHTNVLFDLVLPAGYAGDKVELLTQLEQFIKEQNAAYSCIIKVEQSYTAAHK